jgi:hypothetical protein
MPKQTASLPATLSVNCVVEGKFYRAGDPIPFTVDEVPATLREYLIDPNDQVQSDQGPRWANFEPGKVYTTEGSILTRRGDCQLRCPRAPPFAGYPYRLPARLVKADRGERQEVAGRLRNAEESHSANRISQQDSIRIFTNYTQDRMYLKNPLGRCTRTIAAAAGSRSARRR